MGCYKYVHNIRAHVQSDLYAHALQHTNMCTCTSIFWHSYRTLNTHAWILAQRLNASRSLRLQPFPLCSYHFISLSCSAVTMMTQRLPFYLRAVYHLKAPLHTLIHTQSWDKSIRLMIKGSTEHSVIQMFTAGLGSSWKKRSGCRGGTSAVSQLKQSGQKSHLKMSSTEMQRWTDGELAISEEKNDKRRGRLGKKKRASEQGVKAERVLRAQQWSWRCAGRTAALQGFQAPSLLLSFKQLH